LIAIYTFTKMHCAITMDRPLVIKTVILHLLLSCCHWQGFEDLVTFWLFYWFILLGLLDVPICTVNDYDSAKRSYHLEFPPNGYARDALNLPTECINVNSSQYPMDTLTGLHYFHPLKKLPFGQKQTPQASELSKGYISIIW